VVLASVSPEPVQNASPRGGQEIFRGLFVRPFGPHALAAYREDRSHAAEPVYGLSREDTVRMGLLLEQLSLSERQRRRTAAGIGLAMAGVYGTYFGLAAATSGLTSDERKAMLFGAVLLPSVSLGAGLYRLWRPSERERVLEDFRARLAEPGADQARVVAAIEERLVQIQAEEHRYRTWRVIGGYLATGFAAGVLVASELNKQQSSEYRLLGRGFILGVGGMLLGLTLKEQLSTSPTDNLIELWRKDPRRVPLDFGVAPTRGGGVVGVSGRF
jgi:hypothetical protein